MIITIDGPAASGKSTVAMLIAKRLKIYYLNSGMLYRSLSYCLMNNAGLALQELSSCSLEKYKPCLESMHYSYNIEEGIMKIIIDATDVTNFLKDPLIDKAASLVGNNKNVRDFLMHTQKTIAAENKDLIVEGRDAGSMVFPQAVLKFFLTARLEVRAQRWLNDQRKKGNITLNQEQALVAIEERDKRDENRTGAQLGIHPDDIVIDNSEMSLEQTLERMIQIIHKI